MNYLPESDKLYLECVELVKNFTQQIMMDGLNVKSVYMNVMMAYIDVAYMDARAICEELQMYVDSKQLNQYFHVDYAHPTNMYEPESIVSLTLRREYINQIKEIITLYKLTRI